MCFSPPRWQFSSSRRRASGTAAFLFAIWLSPCPVAAVSASQSSPNVITDAAAFWTIPPDQKSSPHAIRLEGRVSYFDPVWKLFWLEQANVGTFIKISAACPSFQVGQHVIIEGNLVPDRGLEASKVKVTVLEQNAPIQPLATTGRIGDLQSFQSRVVTAEGLVDQQQYIDGDHIRLIMIIDDRSVVAWVKPDDPKVVPDWAGKFLRVEALYSARFDPTGTDTTIELWMGRQRQVSVLGTIVDSPRFNRPATPVSEIYRVPVGTEVLVQGRVEAHEGGSFLVLRDRAAQIVVRSPQIQRMPYGAEVEAVGQVTIAGSRWELHNALFRKKPFVPAAELDAKDSGLETIETLRQLSSVEVERGYPVHIAGLVTWSLPEADFFFLQDVSGGIRVHFDAAKMAAPALGKFLEVNGVTIDGGTVPAVELHSQKDLGALTTPKPKPVTFEQAITGKEDGQWVEMRGFIQRTESEGNWRWIDLTTPAGEVVGHLQSPVNFVANPGSLIRVSGVCETGAETRFRLKSVLLRVPFLHSISVEEDAPLDYFDLPRRSIKALRQVSDGRDMMRVRVAGTVLHAVPGRSLYLQEGDAGVQLLTRATEALSPGDTVEAVGILGREGVRIVLREAVYRKTGATRPPRPVVVVDPARSVPSLDARLVAVRGELIEVSRHPDHTRFTLQAGATLFEATLDHAVRDTSSVPAIGSGLELTGIYQLRFDDFRQTRGFAIQLRTPADILVYRQPPLWTIPRALAACAILAGLTLLGMAWITALRRRVRRQTKQIREQLERQARLEAEVQRAARLESLGELAGGIAHDFNNLLTIIVGNAGLALMDLKVSASTGKYLREIERGVERARNLTRQLLTFAKGGEPVRATLELSEEVRRATDLALHDSNIRCDYTIARDLWPVHADKDQIAQAVHNLVRNAVQAMPKGGVLAVTLANETISAEAKSALPAGSYVKLTFADTGEGMSAEVLTRIFDPYFSTRKTGSGLGLATVYSIVKRHQGRIDAESAPGLGTTFHLWLPVAKPALPVVAATPVLAAQPRESAGVPRVLLMDDEECIREIGATVLRRMGTEPVVVADGGAALREFSLAQHSSRPFSLVILDLTIPGGMGGRESMELIRKLDATVPVIVSSGYSSDPVMANFAEFGFQAVVAKPYDLKEFQAVANRLLGRAP
jgi:two-component system cell cycle sensor histidine kinase/response regulator CckA